MKPTAKVTAAALMGAVSVLLVAMLNHFTDMNLGAMEAQAITVLLSGLAAYMKAES